jgi:gliding motility-associated-like protein
MKQSYTTHYLSILLCIIAFLQQKGEAYASHAQGADLTYQCIGTNQYLVRLAFYRDCSGVAAPTTVSVSLSSVSCGASQNITLNRIAGTGQEVTPICPTMSSTCTGGTYPGVQEYVYTATITLPFACVDWTLGFTLCCRNAAINTINNPGSENIYLESMINNFDYPCNNSPVFSNPPVPFVCVGQPYCFNHGATDPDGDSLAYSLVTPMTGPGTTVTYLPGYSSAQPLLSVPGVSLNPLTGDICMTPQIQEVTVLAVKVDEYRGGVLIGSVTRDIQVRTIACSNNNPTVSGINGTSVFSATACAGSTLSFNVFSNDIDAGQNVSVTWNNAIAGASFTTSAGPHPTGTFTWTPTAAQISTVPYCFTVTVTDDNCPMNGSQTLAYCITVGGFDAVVSTSIANCGASNGGAVVTTSGGIAPFTYLWSYGGTSANSPVNNGLPAGSYTVDVTDVTGCMVTLPFAVSTTTAPGTINFSVNDVTCYGTFSGSATANATGGGAPISYLWSNGQTSATATGLSGGWYSVTATNASGCSKTDSVYINAPAAPLQMSIVSATPPLCFGQTNGTVVVAASGGTVPYTYTWSNSPGLNAPSQGALPAGNYVVTVTDQNGCQANIMAVLPEPAPVNINVNLVEDVSCFGYSNGGAFITAVGGAGTFTYQWTTVPAQFGQGISGVPAGTYTVTATDANGCSTLAGITINQPPQLSVSPLVQNVQCYGQSNGTISMNAAGGVPPYQYLWSNPSWNGMSIVSGVAAGTYQVQITDQNDCSVMATVNVTQPNELILAVTGEDTLCPGENGILNASAAGGISPYTYNWSTGAATGSVLVTPAATQTYQVNVSDANGCSAVPQDVTLWVSDVNDVNLSVTATGNICPGDFTGVSVAYTGGIGTYNVNWSHNLGMGTGPFQVSPDSSGWIVATIVDECMNSISDSVFIEVYDVPAADLIPYTASDCGSVVLSLQNATTTVPGTSYFWDFGDGTMGAGEFPQHVYNQSGSYLVSLTVTSAQGCTNTSQAYYNVNVWPQSVAQFQANSQASEFNPWIHFENQSTFASEWYWDFGDGETSTEQHPSHQYAQAGEYTVLLITTNIHGCSDTTEQLIRITPEFTFYVPNAFTPDGDGVNDDFFGLGSHIDELEMMVFDRWGEMIYNGEGADAKWDGTYNGSVAKQDVYVYRFKVKDYAGRWHMYEGHITLLK